MSDQPPTKYPSAPSLPTQSEGTPQEAPWQTAMRYFTERYANGSQHPPQGAGPSTSAADGPLSGLQKALAGWMANRTTVRTSVTVESGSASESTAARDEPSPLSKALDYLSLTVFAPEMLPSSDSRSSIGVTVVRPPSRSCLRGVRSAPGVAARSAASAPARPLGQRYQPRPAVPRLSAPAVRNRYRLKLVPSTVQRKRPPRRAASTTQSQQLSLPSSRSCPQCHYVSFADGQPACCVVLPPSSQPSCCSECRCGNRFPDPLEIFRTFSLAYNTFRLQQSPFGMTSLLPYWPMPQYPYYFYPPGPIVPSFQAWVNSRSTDSSCECQECEREERLRRLTPAKAMHDFSTLVQVAPKGKRLPQKSSKSSLSKRRVVDTTPGKTSDNTVETAAKVSPGLEVARKESKLLAESIDSDSKLPSAPAVPTDSQTVQQPATVGSTEASKASQSAKTATGEHATSPDGPKPTSPSATAPVQPAEVLAQVLPPLAGVQPAAQPNAQDSLSEPQAQRPESVMEATVQPGLPSTEQSGAHEGMQSGGHEAKQPAVQGTQLGTHEDRQLAKQGGQPGAHEQKQLAMEEKQPGAEGKPGTHDKQHPAIDEAKHPDAHEEKHPGTQERTGAKEEKNLREQGEEQVAVMQPGAQVKPDTHEGKQARSEVSPSDPNAVPQQHSNTSKSPTTVNMAGPPNQGRTVSQPPETRAPVPQSPNKSAALPEHSAAGFSPELVTVPPVPEAVVNRPSNIPLSDDIPNANAESLPPDDAMQNVPGEDNHEVMGENPIAIGTAPAAVAQDDDSSNGASEKSTEEPGAAGESLELHESSRSNAEHIVDMMHAEDSKMDEHAVDMEPAGDVQPAPSDGTKPGENVADVKQEDEKPAEAAAAVTASPPNNLNGAIMNCACVIAIAIILVVVYSIMTSNTAKPAEENVAAGTPRVTLMFDIEHYNISQIKADEEETTHISPIEF